MIARSLVASLVLAVAATPSPAQISANPKLRAPFRAVVAKANESTVRVRVNEKDVVLGTVVFADGFILTKSSELLASTANSKDGVISVRLPDGSEYEAKLVATHVPTDLAMLKVDIKDLKPVTFADAKKVPIGNWLAAAGPASDPVAVGIVSHGPRDIPKMMGIMTNPDSVIINSNRGFLGIMPVDEKDKDGKVIGAKIESLEPTGGAGKAGLKKDDVIVEVNGKVTPGGDTLRSYLENLRPGDSVKLSVLRAGEKKEFTAKLTGPLEADRGAFQNSMGSELSGRRTGFPAILQTDMVVEPKNCGGPVVDLEGHVLGVSIARAGRVETWILPSENIRPLLDDLKAGKSTAAPKK